jgi:hypothetical protein
MERTDEKSVSPISGRIVMRLLADGSGSLLGTLRFAQGVDIAESAGYLFSPRDTGSRLYRQPYDAGLPEGVEGYGINHALTQPHWPVFLGARDLMLVRFVAAFPADNVWAVYGAAKNLAVPSSHFEPGHIWFDVGSQGKLHGIPAPAEGNGLSCAQLLTQLCVWPDAAGRLHCLAQHPRAWRTDYLELAELTAQVGEGCLSEMNFFHRVRAKPRLQRTAPLRVDMDYARYLVHLKAKDGLQLSGPMTAEQMARQDALSKRILRELRLTEVEHKVVNQALCMLTQEPNAPGD